MSDEHEISRTVLKRKRQKRSRSRRKNQLDNAKPPRKTPWVNGFINYSVLGTSFLAAALKLNQTDLNALNYFLIWGIFSAITTPRPGATLDSWLLPVSVACTFDIRILTITMAAGLGCRGKLGTFLGACLAAWGRGVPRYCYVAPLLVRFLLSTLEFSGASLDMNERILISTGAISFIFIGAASIGIPWIILVSALVGFFPCLSTVPRAVAILRQYKRGIDTKSLEFWANVTYLAFFATAGLTFFLFSSGKPVIAEAISTITEGYKTIIWWICCLGVAFGIAYFAPSFDLDSRRKLWHLCSVAMFLPTSKEKVTSLALACVIALFLKLELIRAAALPPLGQYIHQQLRLFTDHRDTCGPLVISHIYLLLGIACPIFASAGSPAGVICLGLGDTFASQIGRRYGRLRIFGDKSLEGTIAFFAAVFTCLWWIHELGVLRTAVISAGCALLEAVSPINDNLVLPMSMLLFERLASYY